VGQFAVASVTLGWNGRIAGLPFRSGNRLRRNQAQNRSWLEHCHDRRKGIVKRRRGRERLGAVPSRLIAESGSC
jgi:hypothetical protein